MKTIDQVNHVADLAPGEIATPEPYTRYTATAMLPDNGRGPALPVDHVIRRGDRLYAVTPDGEFLRITGFPKPDDLIYILTPHTDK